jgi:flagellar biosynthetic protein FliR
MDWWHLIDTSRVVVFVLVLTRVSGLVIMAPVMHTTDAPMQFRALLAFAFTLTIMPSQWFVEVVEPCTLLAFVIMIAAELLIGLAMGLGLYILFVCIGLAGELVGHVGGLYAAQIFDPGSGEQIPLMSRAYQWLAITVFALIGGLTVLVTSLLDTFVTIPVGTIGFNPDVVFSLVVILNMSFNLALQIAAPVLVAALISLFVMGLLSKTLPQFNLMSVGFGINSMIMFAVMGLTIGLGMWAFQSELGKIFEVLFAGLHTTLDQGLVP